MGEGLPKRIEASLVLRGLVMVEEEEEKPIWMGCVGFDEQLGVAERAEEVVEVDIVQCRAASFIHVELRGGRGDG